MRKRRQPLRGVLLRQVKQNGVAVPNGQAVVVDRRHLPPRADALERFGLVLARQHIDELAPIGQIDQGQEEAHLVAVAGSGMVVERDHGERGVAPNR
ncbi:hypothetical protein D3C73_1229820 [compost metagenome]